MIKKNIGTAYHWPPKKNPSNLKKFYLALRRGHSFRQQRNAKGKIIKKIEKESDVEEQWQM